MTLKWIILIILLIILIFLSCYMCIVKGYESSLIKPNDTIELNNTTNNLSDNITYILDDDGKLKRIEDTKYNKDFILDKSSKGSIYIFKNGKLEKTPIPNWEANGSASG